MTQHISRIICIQCTHDLFKQGWGGPSGTQAITLAKLSEHYVQFCCPFLIFFSHFWWMYLLLAHSQCAFSIVPCKFIWQNLCLSFGWLEHEVLIFLLLSPAEVQGWKCALVIFFESGQWGLMAPGVSSWHCQVKIHQVTMCSLTLSYQPFWCITYMTQIIPIFLHNAMWRKCAQKKRKSLPSFNRQKN